MEIDLFNKEKLSKQDFTVESMNSRDAAIYILDKIKSDEKYLIIHLNCYNYYRLLKRIPNFDLRDRKLLFLLEGIALKTAAKIVKRQAYPDCNGTDAFPLICELGSGDLRLFMLGADQEINERACENIRNKFDDVNIRDSAIGYFSIEDELKLSEKINRSNSNLLAISCGIDKELDFLERNIQNIDAEVIWCLGGLFDFLSGNKKRAPQWIRNLRMEWLFRFIIEPRRMFFRYFVLQIWTLKKIMDLKIQHKKLRA
jgi:exopolysaccharide biosynthesis WecB/TagA/CpsF family protein